MAFQTSQGGDFGIEGATKVTIKKSRPAAGDNKLDSSDLGIAHGGNRTYEDGLEDNGPAGAGNNGITTEVTVEFLGATAVTVGDITDFDGVECKCTEVEISNEVGALVKGTATYTSDFASEQE